MYFGFKMFILEDSCLSKHFSPFHSTALHLHFMKNKSKYRIYIMRIFWLNKPLKSAIL